MKYKLINLKKGGIIFFILFITIISNVYCQYNPPPSDYSLLEPQNFNNDVILPAQINTFLNGTCDNTMSNTSIDFVNKYYPLSFWIPNNNTPIKKIQIAIHVFSGTNSMTVGDGKLVLGDGISPLLDAIFLLLVRTYHQKERTMLTGATKTKLRVRTMVLKERNKYLIQKKEVLKEIIFCNFSH